MSALVRIPDSSRTSREVRKVPLAEVNALIRSPRRRWRGAFLRGRAVLGGVGAFGDGYGLARISAFTYRRRLWESWAHSRRPIGPTHRGSRTR
jgi:hypothetical protein